MDKLRILQVVHGFPPYNFAGTEIYTYNLCSELAKKHDIFVFFRISDTSKKEYAVTKQRVGNIETFAINNTFKLYEDFEMTYKNNSIDEAFGSLLDTIKPDIVHIQHLLYLGVGIIEKAKEKGIPVVFTLHDYWLICPQGQLLNHRMEVCRKNESHGCVSCVDYQLSIKRNVFKIYYLFKKYLPGWFLQLAQKAYLFCFKTKQSSRSKASQEIGKRASYIRLICDKVDLFLSPSGFLKNKFVERGIKQEKIVIMQNGLNLRIFKQPREKPFAKFRFGYIGNFLPGKGLDVLIEAFNKVNNDSIELRVYGKNFSYKSIVRNYLKHIKRIAKNKNIKFMGGFDNNNVANIFKEIDVLVVPSIWPENAPLVIQEAFASKTPVIASNIGGIPEFVIDSVNGLLFNPKDTGALREKLEYIINNREIITKFKENMPEIKSIEKHAKEIEDVYSNLISNYHSYVH